MKETYAQIAKDFGQEKVIAMQQVAKDLINGDQVSFQDFQEVKRKSLDYFRGYKDGWI